MAPRAMASGTISFGLVAIPVKLYTSSEPSKTVRFNSVHKSCGSRVKYRYYCPTDDRLVERDELAKGYEFAKGQYVLFSPEEIKALQPEPTHAIEIAEFVPLDKIDPIFYEKAYFMGPDKGGARPYKLLAEALKETNRAAIARYAARGKNHLVLVRSYGAGLILQQLHYAQDLRDFSEVPMEDAELKPGELDLARMLIQQGASEDFKPEGYEDEVRQQIWDLIDRKVQGEEIVASPDEAPKAQVIDLMAALKASLGADAEGESRKPPKRSDRQPARQKTAEAKAE